MSCCIFLFKVSRQTAWISWGGGGRGKGLSSLICKTHETVHFVYRAKKIFIRIVGAMQNHQYVKHSHCWKTNQLLYPKMYIHMKLKISCRYKHARIRQENWHLQHKMNHPLWDFYLNLAFHLQWNHSHLLSLPPSPPPSPLLSLSFASKLA